MYYVQSVENQLKAVLPTNVDTNTITYNEHFVISDNPAHMVRLAFNDICIPISCNKAIIFRIKDESAPIISKDMPIDGVINLSLNSVVAYNSLQLQSGQKFLFGTSKAVKFMKNIWELDQAIKKRNQNF